MTSSPTPSCGPPRAQLARANGAPAVISFMNSGGIRSDINVGPITYGEAFNVQPFANVLVTMDMTGAQIDALLEQQFTGGNGVPRSRRR